MFAFFIVLWFIYVTDAPLRGGVIEYMMGTGRTRLLFLFETCMTATMRAHVGGSAIKNVTCFMLSHFKVMNDVSMA